MRLLICLNVLFGLFASCSTPALLSKTTQEPMTDGGTVFTQVNLRPDMKRKLLYSANFQREGLIPICTEVRILSFRSREAIFKNLSTNEDFRYEYHKTSGETLERHLQQVFDKGCPKDKIAKLSPLDQEGIKNGKVSKGMSKQGVIYAIGYPPKGSTPDITMNEWRYWQSRFDSFIVKFKDDKVFEIKD